ncbi:Do family serine endopeptidase [Rhizobium sp. G187]|uniref:Do family serine endopeptidase n=1 Tax=unclassified Rhizobium TaxID=2613769 RepID=UPI0006B8D377|nr:Do family serine endopeptidase [Rhizobium sp. AAP43]KPF42377.1 serine protease [Rhizobium sp. AAP43]
MFYSARTSRIILPALILGSVLGGGTVTVPTAVEAKGPESVADLASGLLGAVVNISTSQSVKEEGEGPVPKVPEGSPFEELFEDFYRNREEGDSDSRVNSLGSGFVIDPAGFVVTNNHVIEGADDIEVIFSDGSKLKAKLIGTDTKTDLSVLKVEPPQPLTAVKFGDSRKMRIGDWVMAIGNPFGLGGSVTVGIISASGRNINAGPYDNFIQTDAAINKGNSGGPLFNMDGEVIGINTAIISPSGGSIGIGFAVPTELAENIVKQLIEFGETRRGWLGVRIQPVSDELARSLDLPRPKGALISGVVEGGPVEKGPIVVGDVIIRFNGRDIGETRDLTRIVAESPIGEALDVVVLRDGKEQSLKVTLGELKDDAATNASDEPSTPAEPETDGSNPDADQGTDPNADPGVEPDGEQVPGDETEQEVTEPQAPDAANAAPVTEGLIGVEISILDDAKRTAFGISEGVEGVLITRVLPGSKAEGKGLKVGDVIVEVAQEFMRTPQQVAEKLTSIKGEGRRSGYLMIADKSGNLKLVAVPLE